VLTSSTAAVANSGREIRDRPMTEEDWSDPANPDVTPYVRSKTIAELAAWDFVRERNASERLATIEPSAILGPALSDDRSYSLEAVERLLNGMPAVPKLGFSFVDVRDVADLHIRAMTASEAGGERFLAAGPFLWMAEVAVILRERLGADGSKIPTRQVPNFVVRAMARFDPGLRTVVGDLGRRREFSSEKAKRKLGWTMRPIEDTIVDCAQSLMRLRTAAAAA
jgi:nucleoside-diphosphate-sugar epimerase